MQDSSAYPFFSSPDRKPIAPPIDFKAGDMTIRVEAVPDHAPGGLIWDADILIWAASRIVEARDAQACAPPRLMADSITFMRF